VHDKTGVNAEPLREDQIPGAGLLSFGDGYVEIENTREAEGYGAAS